MPEALKAAEVESHTDPTVAKQWDGESSAETKFDDFYKLVDGFRAGLLATYRSGVGPVARSMAVAKRTGPDFLFLANSDSKKFQDLEANKEVTITFQNSSTQDWVSVTGEATTMSNDDPRIKALWSKPMTSIWFGDLGDGKHTGGPEDPRMKLIEIQAKYISYWKAKVGALGMIKEVAGAMMTGGVAVTGILREMTESEISEARARDSTMSK